MGGAGESRLYQTSLAGVDVSLAPDANSDVSADLVPMRLLVCQFWLEKVASPVHGLLSAASPPTERLGSWAPSLSDWTPAIAEPHGQLSTNDTNPGSGVAEWQPMQVGLRTLNPMSRLGCCTFDKIKASTTPSSPTLNPRRMEVASFCVSTF